jgi:hypothetical protein
MFNIKVLHLKLCHFFILIFLIILIAINFQMTLRLISVDFRVYGRVQGIIQSNVNKLLISKTISI